MPGKVCPGGDVDVKGKRFQITLDDSELGFKQLIEGQSGWFGLNPSFCYSKYLERRR